MPINGNYYDWEAIEFQLPHGAAVNITDISYSDEKAIDPRYGQGSMPRGYGRGNYKANGSMTLDLQEFEALKKGLNGSIYTAKPGQIVVSYANDDMPTVTDTLPDVKFTKTDTSSKQGDTNVGARKLDFQILSPIKWGDQDAYSEGSK